MNRTHHIVLGLLCLGFATTSAQAEVGRASAGPGEWFLGFNAGGGTSWGPEKQAFAQTDLNTGGSIGEVNLDDGAFYFGGIEIGHVLANPSLPLDRVELNLDLRKMTRSLDQDPGQAALLVIDKEALGGGFIFDGDDTSMVSDDDESDIEVRLSLKSTLADSDSGFVLASLEPFYRFQHAKGRTEGTQPSQDFAGTREDKTNADYYGVQIALESEHSLSESMSLIGRASAGIYYVTSDIDARVFAPGVPFNQGEADDDDSGWGGRFGGALGVKVPLYYAGASLSLLATLDYMTDVATVHHTRSINPIDSTGADFDHTLDVGGRVGLIIPLK